jgi:hypothetical protein
MKKSSGKWVYNTKKGETTMQPDPKVSGQSGESELPTPTFSDQAPSSPSSDVDAIVSKLTPILESLVEKKVQSTKDKRFSQIEKVLGGRLDLLAELEGRGVQIPAEVRTQMEIQDLRDQITQPKPDQPAPVRDDGSSQQRQAVTEAIAELTKYSLNSNDPAFIDVLRGQYRDRASFDLAVNKYILGRVAQPQTIASPATIVQPPVTSRAVGERSKDQLQADYETERNRIAASMKGDGKIRALTELKTKYREEHGLDLH